MQTKRRLCLGLLCWMLLGCVSQVERVCESDTSCQATNQQSVCIRKRCVSVLCEEGEVRPCYEGPAQTAGKGTCQEGRQLCIQRGTAWSACWGQRQPSPELCDGADNDCDGQVDEELDCQCQPGAQRRCFSGPKSAQKLAPSPCREGIQYCQANARWGQCTREVLPDALAALSLQKGTSDASGVIKSCPEVDRDCDGLLDQSVICACELGQQRPCPSTAGQKAPCQAGTQRCIQTDQGGTTWGFCEGGQGPSLEEQHGCNGIDDDCDGKIDNQSGTSAPLWQTCPTPTCSIKVCTKDGWSLCRQVELCHNQMDDDCDGQVDEATDCLSVP